MHGMFSFFKRDIAFLLLLCGAILWLYAPAMNNVVIFDDAQFIRDGHLRTDLISSLPRFVTNISFVWVASISNANIAAQKLFNITIHCGVVAMLYFVTRRILHNSAIDGNKLAHDTSSPVGDTAIKIAVTLFALNPVAVYSVAYLAQRTILLATFFTLAMTLTFLRALTMRKTKWLGVALLCYALAVLSKELAVTALLIPALLYVQHRNLSPRQLLAPVLSACALAGLLAYYFLTQYHVALMVPYEPAAQSYVSELNAMRSDSGAHIFLLNALNQFNLFFLYALLWLLPNPQWMSIDLHPIFPTMDLLAYYIPLALLYIACCLGALKLFFSTTSNTSRTVGTLLLIPLLFFAAELFIIRLQEPFVLYRSYLWAIALPGLIAIALSKIKRPGVLAAVGLALVVPAGACTINRVHTFTDNFLIWTDAIATSERYAFFRGFGSWRPYINRGSVYLAQNDIRHALEDFNHADRLGALNGVAKYNAGIVFQTLDQHQLAVDTLKDAERFNHLDPLLQYHIAESYYAMQQFDSALYHYDAAMALVQDPATSALVRTRKAETLVVLKRFADAKPLFDDLLVANPGDARASIGLGMAYLGLGNAPEAEQSFQQVLQAGANANAYYGLALLRESQSRWTDAGASLEQAIALEPHNTIYQDYRSQLQSMQAQSKPTPKLKQR